LKEYLVYYFGMWKRIVTTTLLMLGQRNLMKSTPGKRCVSPEIFGRGL